MIVPPAKKLEDLIHLAELCVDLLQQNEEHYAEVSGHGRAVFSTGIEYIRVFTATQYFGGRYNKHAKRNRDNDLDLSIIREYFSNTHANVRMK